MSNKRIQLYIEDQQVDLYDTENIVVNSSVQNINDISKIFTDFSQSFTVPATQINNKIFKYYFEPDLDNGFDARVKKDARLEIATAPFREGKIRLESVKMKGGKASSYKITFFGNLTNLTDLFGEDKLSSLDLSAYDHPRTFAQARDGMKIGLFGNEGDVVIYPLLSNRRQFYYNSDTTDNVNIEEEDEDGTPRVNIAYDATDSGSDDHGVKWDEVKPAILVNKIIDRIQTKYGVTFSDDFFGLPFWDEFYLWLQNTDEDIPTSTAIELIDFESHDSGDFIVDLTNDVWNVNLVSNSGSSPNVGTQRARLDIGITPSSGFTNVKYTVFKQVDDEEPVPISNEASGSIITASITRILQNGTFNRSIRFYLQAQEAFNFDLLASFQKQQWNGSSWVDLQLENTSSTNLTQNPTVQISRNMPDITVAEFFKGIISMFNLVILPNTTTDFYIDTLDNWYNLGDTIDISRYVNTKEYDIKRSKIISDIALKFQEGESILIDQRFNTFGTYYGDVEIDIKDEEGENIEGETFEIELPFEQVVYERLLDINDDSQTEIQYGLITDSNIDPIVIKPHLFFAENITGMSKQWAILDQNDVASNSSSYWKVSHVSSDGSTASVFNNELDEFTSTQIENNLYSNYYSDYVGDIFDPKRRIFTFEGTLPISILTQLELNDRVVIDSVRYLINKLETNLTKDKVKLELLNDIY